MAKSETGTIIRHLRRMVLRVDGAGMTDGQLLEEFVSRRDAAAFESLVRRHGPMVLGICRRILRDPHDAEDAFQSTFLVLARKAESVSPREMLGNWLYGVARTTAIRLRSANAKRRVREKQMADMPEPEVEPRDLQDDLRQLLDEELARLPDKFRLPIVLCDLEGRTRREVARQLKLPEGTLSSRLTTARRMLAKRLARHGLAVSVGTLTAALAPSAASASVAVSLLSSTVKTATLLAAGQTTTGLVSVHVAALTEGVLKAMFLTKIKTVMGMMLVVASLCGAAGLVYQTQAAEQRKTTKAPEKDEQEKHSAAKKNENPKPSKLQRPKDDLLAIRGVWRVISVQYDNEEDADKGAIVWKGSRWIIHAEFMDIRMKEGGGVGFGYKLDPSSSPKILDLRILGRTVPAIYALESDVLQIRMGLHERTRPKALTSKDAGNTVLLILKREPAPKRKAQAATEKVDKERLQGTWKMVSFVVDGQKDEPEVSAEWTFKETTIKHVFSATKNTGAFTSYYRFRLDETMTPKRIDIVAGKADDLFDTAVFDKRLDDANMRIEGIYSITGNTLKICINPKKGERPTAFESKAGSNYILIVFNKEKPKGERKKVELEKKQKSEAASSKSGESAGYSKIRTGPQEYKDLFIKTLGIVAGRFEQIIYANQYEGRIEAYKLEPLRSRTAIQQHAFVRFQACDDGYLIKIRIDKVRMAGTPSEKVVGRNIELERVILKKLDAQPAEKDALPSGAPPALPKEREEKD